MSQLIIFLKIIVILLYNSYILYVDKSYNLLFRILFSVNFILIINQLGDKSFILT